MTPEEQKTALIEEIETTLFYNKKLINIINDVLDDVIKYDVLNFENFKFYFNDVIISAYDDNLKWLIIKEYTTIENINKINLVEAKKELFEDIKKCFNVVGV